MSRVEPVSKIEDPQLSALFEKGSEIMGFTSVDALIMAHCPEALGSTSSWIMSVLQKGQIDAGLKRLIGYICSTAAGCTYCSAHTNYTARFYNVDEAKMKSKLERITDYVEGDEIEKKWMEAVVYEMEGYIYEAGNLYLKLQKEHPDNLLIRKLYILYLARNVDIESAQEIMK